MTTRPPNFFFFFFLGLFFSLRWTEDDCLSCKYARCNLNIFSPCRRNRRINIRDIKIMIGSFKFTGTKHGCGYGHIFIFIFIQVIACLLSTFDFFFFFQDEWIIITLPSGKHACIFVSKCKVSTIHMSRYCHDIGIFLHTPEFLPNPRSNSVLEQPIMCQY